MLRQALLHNEHEPVDNDGFRLRGLGFSRLDAFSDVVFGFALTLLVVSLEVPKNYEELHHLWYGFVPFGISFLLLMLVWYGHYTFFRRFGTHDAGTVWLNGLLLFVILFYVYPLKFLFLSAFGQSEVVMAGDNMREVVLLFAAGLATIYFLFSALYANAYRQRDKLALTPLERMLTRNFIVEEAGTGFVGVLVCLLAAVVPPNRAGMTCLLFMVIGVWKSVMGRRSGRAARRMHAQSEAIQAPADA
ncbi:putative integral membrane protein [Terriglobus roseus DSM 18391]|uniref:Putative integral membrane protein n=1 Tax=Terriglobus roseus (strain DSM 18391 / NRRL B-41598 / KBS 63) TaxID=926566 RepID=I3ZJU2_TERRK|nr:TMEM175 family protein [Terriglobus roseus]AFL89510.1 putative integral membrane protein [Terriglobus roseus DSM 18391]